MAWLATCFVVLGASSFKLQSNHSTVLEETSNAWELVLKVAEDDKLRACTIGLSGIVVLGVQRCLIACELLAV